jgi:CheY-like chemotaxis protein
MDVLVVDDDAAVRQGFVRILQQAGFSVSTADNGLSAFGVLKEQDCRVILCDIKMPTLEGKNFFEQLEEGYPHLAGRVVFVTAWTGDEQIRGFLERSGQPFFRKPIDPERLIEVVRSVVTRA